ncbi:hypothetical protein MKEN_00412300 [Mycena kentingensis (nom. inval.)]|nr:hypothetical protein MKEN_00412300 [Mycena kentingensis (nom. inval.)]
MMCSPPPSPATLPPLPSLFQPSDVLFPRRNDAQRVRHLHNRDGRARPGEPDFRSIGFCSPSLDIRRRPSPSTPLPQSAGPLPPSSAGNGRVSESAASASGPATRPNRAPAAAVPRRVIGAANESSPQPTTPQRPVSRGGEQEQDVLQATPVHVPAVTEDGDGDEDTGLLREFQLDGVGASELLGYYDDGCGNYDEDFEGDDEKELQDGPREPFSQLKKLFFGVLRIQKQQEAADRRIKTERPAVLVIFWDAIKTRMNEASRRQYIGFVTLLPPNQQTGLYAVAALESEEKAPAGACRPQLTRLIQQC